MNIITLLIPFSMLILLTIEALSLRTSLLCRQNAWLKLMEMKTRSLLTIKRDHEISWDRTCNYLFTRRENKIRLQKFPSLTSYQIELGLKGGL
jgi:hypothetical protein